MPLLRNYDLQTEFGPLQVKVYAEKRRNVRFGISTQAAILRLPLGVSRAAAERHEITFHDWIRARLRTHPELHLRLFGQNYRNKEMLTVGRYLYRIEVTHSPGKAHRGSLHRVATASGGGDLIMKLKVAATSTARSKLQLRRLVSDLVIKHQREAFVSRVNDCNQTYFKREIDRIKFRFNQTNWGSCSRTGSLSFSSRLLFAPLEVQHYVIVHELAHLVEPNHGSAFWKQVERVIPDYLKFETWLHEHGATCQF